ncbi:hypothetical protein LCGC14_2123320 [marine sediment metagenome]|uniref:Uncharacterized protein n=1 Tax=marine sediment metagenome TaxID=412755 RepID=A0A0F9GGN7_9ZZZZ|nr:hypothetical protein [Candidatus Pacearchaeota archaeon]
MVHTGIYATSAEIIFKMGSGYDTTNVDEAVINRLSLQAESYINVLCKQVFAVNATAFTALDVGKKYLLSETSSNFAATYGILYNISGYNSTREAENMANLCWRRFNQCIKLLQEQNTVTFLK